MAGVFVAFTILFTYVFSIQTPFVRISLGFLPTAVYASLAGPLRGCLAAVLADILGAVLFTGMYFPGFTLSAALAGSIYGFFLYRKPISLKRICLPFLLVFVIVDLGCNTIWLTLLYHKAASVFFLSRLMKAIICLPGNIFLFYLVYRPLYGFMPKLGHH
jgi:ECF transporter S component (folate family)